MARKESLLIGVRDADHGRDAALDIVVRGGPAGDRYSHRSVALPLCACAPAGSISLDGGDDAPSLFRANEGNQDLVQHDIVQNSESSGAQAIGEEARLAAVALDHLTQPGAA